MGITLKFVGERNLQIYGKFSYKLRKARYVTHAAQPSKENQFRKMFLSTLGFVFFVPKKYPPKFPNTLNFQRND